MVFLQEEKNPKIDKDSQLAYDQIGAMIPIAMIERRAAEEIADRDLRLIIKDGKFLASAEGQNFDCRFGRDSAWETLFLLEAYKKEKDPFLLSAIPATLTELAHLQGKKVDPSKEETPWKILHEYRTGKSQQKKLEIFHKNGWPVEGNEGARELLYYGSEDATMLWTIGAIDYIKTTNDWILFSNLKENIRNALLWPEVYGDIDTDGFVEFKSNNRKALINQGWQDSGNSLLLPNGERPPDPIALAEIQAYTYAAWIKGSEIFEKEDPIFANNLKIKAQHLKEKFNKAFWMEDEKYYAQALYGENGGKKQLKAISSNIGHCLFFEIIDKDKAPYAVKRLAKPDMLTPWGIRTLSSSSPNFTLDPELCYHLGTVWPFDSAICAIGFRNYGFEKEADLVDTANLKTFLKVGSAELVRVDKKGNLLHYPGCSQQGWTVCAIKEILSRTSESSSRNNSMQ